MDLYRIQDGKKIDMKRILIIIIGLLSLGILYAQELSEEQAFVSADIATSEELEMAHTYNPSNSLYGLISGLTVLQTGTLPWDDAATLMVRGLGSFNGNNVLIIIDGVPGRNLSLLNVGEIESIKVLKDAASLAIYGNRGADGAILITTRRGIQKGLKIDVDYNYSLMTPFRLPKMANNYEYALALNEALANDGYAPRYSQTDLVAIKDRTMPDVFPTVNWQEEVLRNTAHKHEMNLSVKGGEKFVRYFVHANYTGYFGLFNNTKLNSQYSSQLEMHNLKIRSNIEADITPSTLLKVKVMGKLTQNQYPYYGYDLSSMYATPSLAFPVQAPDKTWYASNMFVNPLADAVAQGNNINFNRYLYADIDLTQDLSFIRPGLDFTIGAAYDNGAEILDTRHKDYMVYRVDYLRDAGNITGVSTTPWGEDTNLTFNNGWLAHQFMRFNLDAHLDYKESFGKHNIDASLMYNLSRTKMLGANNTFLFMDFILRGNYDYAGKYYASIVANCSGSAKLEKGKKFRLYPAASFAWLISEEDFLKDNDVLSHLKLRASYGLVGYDGRLSYDMDKQFNATGPGYVFNNKDYLPGYAQGALPSKNIKPETDYRADLGVDLGLFENNLQIQVGGFFNNRKNIACDGSGTISEVIGIGVPIIFTGETINYGTELSATWKQKLGDFSYNIGANFTYMRNKIIEAAEGHIEYEWQRKAGTQIGEMYGYVPIGYYQDTDFNADGSLKDGLVSSGLIANLHPGDVKYEDLNQDGIIDENDAKYHGVSFFPSIYFGLNFGAEYKSFGFQAMFQGAGNFMVSTNLPSVYQPLYNNDKNISKHYLENYLSKNNPAGRYPRLTTESNAHNFADSPIWWERGDYLKLRNLYLWYDFGPMIPKIDSFKLFFRGHNLFSIDSVKIFDPEHISLAYPTTRSYQIGLKLVF